MNKKGFTLVELSIVLVIIGLLTGGILGANSMIKAARTQKAVSVFEQIFVAMQQFNAQYGTVAGDLANAYDFFGSACGTNYYVAEAHWYSGGCNGDGNGIISHVPVEKRISWVHLTHAEMWGDKRFSSLTWTNASAPDQQNTINNTIAAPYDGTYIVTETPSWWHRVPVSTTETPSPGAKYTLVLIDANLSNVNAVKVSDAAALDAKMDDGVGNTGLVRGSYTCLGNGGHGATGTWNRSSPNKCDVFVFPPALFNN